MLTVFSSLSDGQAMSAARLDGWLLFLGLPHGLPSHFVVLFGFYAVTLVCVTCPALLPPPPGPEHSAAAAEGGWLYCWGSNDKGQLGCGWGAAPTTTHTLPDPAPAPNSSSSSNRPDGAAASWEVATVGGAGSTSKVAGDGSSLVTGGAINISGSTVCIGGGTVNGSMLAATLASTARTMHKLDSFDVLTSTVKLTPELQQQLAREHAQQVAARQEQQLKEEAAKAAAQQQHLSEKLAQRSKRGVSRLLGGDQDAPVNPGQPSVNDGQPQLQVYRFCLGQAVHMLACGGKHTLAALVGGGLLAWGDNSWGQLGAPAAMYPAAWSPMRIHAFDAGWLTHISAGGRHSAAVQDCGTVVCWGCGK